MFVVCRIVPHRDRRVGIDGGARRQPPSLALDGDECTPSAASAKR